ncbi:MAG TPA: hypothetical protein DCR93_11015, partial [Cytophagales bacterium]|nr:hypothetical protein [Cytophagales bacterium]
MFLSRLSLCALLGLNLLASCGPTSQPSPKLVVSPDTSLYHHPLQIRAEGLQPGQSVWLKVQAVDAEENQWASEARYEANPQGVVNPELTPALEGTYQGTYPMGLLWSMKSADDHQIATGSGYTATVELWTGDSAVA